MASSAVECSLLGEEVVVAGEDVAVAVNDHDNVDDSIDEDSELSWRLDPARSLSDWTVQIVTVGRKQTVTTYHVHKSVLAVGPRRSNYFATCFAAQSKMSSQKAANSKQHLDLPAPVMGIEPCDFVQQSLLRRKAPAPWRNYMGAVVGNTSEDKAGDCSSNVTRIELHELAAKAFPVLLDFLYSTGHVDIYTENATPLHHLANLLEIKLLKRICHEFWTKDLKNMDHLMTYYTQARDLSEEEILEQVVDTAARNIFLLSESAVVDFLTALDPQTFHRIVAASMDVMKSSNSETKYDDDATLRAEEASEQTSHSLRLSLLIAVYCNIHRHELSKSIFERVTDEQHMPVIEAKAATALLEMEDDICGKNGKLTSLKARCIAILSQRWDDACIISDDSTSVKLPNLHGYALQTFVSKSLVNAKKRLNAVVKERDREREKLRKRNAAMEKELKQMQQRLDEVTLRARLQQQVSPPSTNTALLDHECNECN